MRRKSIFTDSPWYPLMTVAGAVATITGSALIYVGPALGFPLIDIPSIVGRTYAADPDVALLTGYAIFFVGGWIVFPTLLKLLWVDLPGDGATASGAALKGAIFGLAAWLLSGLAVGILEGLARDPGAEAVGFFAAGVGVPGIVALLGGHLVYGVSLAVVAGAGRGLSPLDALGWLGHGAGHLA